MHAASPVSWARYASGGTWKAAPHLLLLNRVLMAAAAGERWASRVIIQMPPRHGKSEFASGYFPAWYLGMFPDRKVILASYADTFAAQWGQRNRDLLEAFGPDVFGIRVRQDSRAKDTWFIQRHRGGMFTAGVGGALTGKGAHLAIIDDPVKNDEQALSPTYRNKAKEWYRSTLRSRMETAHSPIIVIQTRWHTDDLAGWLQTEQPGEWLVISLPAIAEDDECIYLPDDPDTPAWTRKAGEPLWPQKYDHEALLKIQHDQGGEAGYWWLSLYQQRPTPIGGGILKPEQFRRYSLVDGGYLLDTPAGPRLISSTELRKFGTMDLATSLKTHADYTVLGIFGVTGPDLLVLDVLRGKWEGPDLPRVAARVWQAYRPAYIGVEAVGFQQSTVQDMRRGDPLQRPPRPGLPIKALLPQGDKVTRALSLSTRMGGGNVYVPVNAPWLAAVEAEMAQFPKGQHDDTVDVLSYAALEQMTFADNVVRSE
jgi:predicted phage terminase large subunit-like protein